MELKTATGVLEERLIDAPFLEAARTAGASEAVERYVDEKRRAVAGGLRFIEKHQSEPWREGCVFHCIGPMRSGKSLVAQAVVEEWTSSRGFDVLNVSSEVDTRSPGQLVSRCGCDPVESQNIESLDVDSLVNFSGVLRLDEEQYFPLEVLERIVRARTRRGFVTVCSGLDMDYTANPWPSADVYADLARQLTDQLATARLHAICGVCHDEAEFSQLKVPDENGLLVPAPSNLFEGSIAPEGGDLVFTPVCRRHHEVGDPINDFVDL